MEHPCRMMDPDKICRLCLSESNLVERLFDIFSSAIVDGFVLSLPDIINSCVELQLINAKGMPNKICVTCKSQMLSFYFFKQKCKRTEEILRANLLQCAAEAQQDDVVPPVESVPKVAIYDRSYPCRLCSEVFDSAADFNEHVLSHGTLVLTIVKPNEMVGQDESVPQRNSNDDENGLIQFYTEDDMLPKEIVVVPGEGSLRPASAVPSENLEDNGNLPIQSLDETEDLQSTPSKKPTGKQKSTQCKVCGKQCKSLSLLAAHVRFHDASSILSEFFTFYNCNVCRMVFLDKDIFEKHAIVHPQQGNDADGQCTDYQFLDDDRQITRDEGNEEADHTCSVCSAVFANILHAKHHLLSHLKIFSCPFDGCGCQYDSSVRLSQHITSKHIEYASHRCPHCNDDSFDSMMELQQHLRLSCKGKKFPCNHCGKTFVTSRSRAQHLRQQESRYQCDQCNKTFSQGATLKLHQRIHTGERPFRCTVCNKTYKTASMRTAHMDTHIVGKTFECNICGKLLQTRTCHRNHIRRHSEEKKHECEICFKRFYTKYNMKLHKEKVHKLKRSAVPIRG